MKKICLILCAMMLIVCVVGAAGCVDDSVNEEFEVKGNKVVTATKLVTYPGSNLMTSSDIVGVKVESRDLFVYDTRVNFGREFTYSYSKDKAQVVIFDFEGTVNVEVTVKGATTVADVTVRPVAYAIKTSVDGNKIKFSLNHPGNYTVEYNKDGSELAYKNALHIFANDIEEETLDPNNIPADTIYLGPGVYAADSIPVDSDNTTIYIAGGALVYGQIRAADVDKLTIKGRGILCGELFERTKASEYKLPIELQRCTNVTIEDIAILDPAGWAITLYFCETVRVNNVKIITARANGDGISVQSCSDVEVLGGFVRTWDDSLVVKNTDLGNTQGVLFDNVVVWTDLAQSCEVGYETHGSRMEDIRFENITIIHNFHKAAISIHNCDNAVIKDVTFKNITIEDAQMLGDNQLDGENDFLIDFTVAYNSEWTSSGGVRGSISNVTISNVKVLNMADSIVCRMIGESASSNISNISISNIEIEGKKINNLEELKLTPGAYTSGISYKTGAKTVGSTIYLYYTNSVTDASPSITEVEGREQEGLEIPSFAEVNATPSYMGKSIANDKITLTASNGSGDLSNSNSNVAPNNSQANYPISNLIDGNKSSLWKNGQWAGLDKEFVALNFVFDAPLSVGTIRLFGDSSSNILANYNISVYSKNTDTGGWVRQLFAMDYSISAQSSDYADINVRAREYYAIQLRIFAKTGVKYPTTLCLSDIEFYYPSLTTNKSVVAVSEFEDVYDSSNIVDGNDSTYFESKKGVWPAHMTIDMNAVYSVKYINMCLPPLLLWSERTQGIEIMGSLDGANWQTIVANKEYVFDPVEGNRVLIELDSGANARYIKFVFTSNSSGYGAQISELYVFEG